MNTMRMKASIVAGLGLAVIAAPWSIAQAPAPTQPAQVVAIPEDQQASKEQIGKLFEVMRLRQQMASMEQMMPQMVQKQIQAQTKDLMDKMPNGPALTPEQQEQVGKVTKLYMEKAFRIYPAEEMISDATQVYRRHISRDDADALIAFYGSPVGQRLLDAQPAIMQEYMPLVMGRMQERIKLLTGDMAKAMQDAMKAPSSAPEKN